MKYILLFTLSLFTIYQTYSQELTKEERYYKSLAKDAKLTVFTAALNDTKNTKIEQGTYPNSNQLLFQKGSIDYYKKFGSTLLFYESGEIKFIKNYFLGYPIGLMVSYYKNGTIKALYDFGSEISDFENILKIERYLTQDSGPVGDTLIGIPFKGECIDFYENGCIKRKIVYENEKCSYQLFYDENEFFIKRKECEFEYLFCDFERDWLILD